MSLQAFARGLSCCRCYHDRHTTCSSLIVRNDDIFTMGFCLRRKSGVFLDGITSRFFKSCCSFRLYRVSGRLFCFLACGKAASGEVKEMLTRYSLSRQLTAFFAPVGFFLVTRRSFSTRFEARHIQQQVLPSCGIPFSCRPLWRLYWYATSSNVVEEQCNQSTIASCASAPFFPTKTTTLNRRVTLPFRRRYDSS